MSSGTETGAPGAPSTVPPAGPPEPGSAQGSIGTGSEGIGVLGGHASDAGRPVAVDRDGPSARAFHAVAGRLAAQVSIVNAAARSAAPLLTVQWGPDSDGRGSGRTTRPPRRDSRAVRVGIR